jgi:hypothetical protein
MYPENVLGLRLETPYIIVSAISKIPELNTLHLLVEPMHADQRPTFIQQLDAASNWRLNTLLLVSSGDIAEVLLKKCKQIHSLQHYATDGYFAILPLLKKYHPKLQRLHFTNDQKWFGSSFPSMDYMFIEQVFSHLEHLTWLTIDDPASRRFWSWMDMQQRFVSILMASLVDTANCNKIDARDRMVEELQRFPTLERFSFTITQMLSEILRQLDAGVPRGHAFEQTEAEIDQWYLMHLTHVANAVPHLKQLCVKGHHPIVYIASRESAGQPCIFRTISAEKGTRSFPWTIQV